MSHWLLKSEPDVFGYPDLERVGREPWNGVRNYQARNFLRQMAVGNLCLFYHSRSKVPGVAGVARITRAAHTDDLQFDPASAYFDPTSDPQQPRWSMVEVEAVRAFPEVLALDAIRALPEWETSSLTRKGSRLSVLPVSAEQFGAALTVVGLKVAELERAARP